MAERKLDLDAHEQIARAARPGPWQWYGNTKTSEVYLATVHGGRVFVMDFVRWGMTDAQPRFQIDQRMMTLSELGKAEHPMGPRFEAPHRRDFYGIGHPDPTHIAANSPDVTLALIARIRELETALAETLNHWCADQPDLESDGNNETYNRGRVLAAKKVVLS